MSTTYDTAQRHLADQREYVKTRQLDDQRQAASRQKAGSGLVDEKMLAESMRSVRYKDEAHAAGDIIDNAIEAGASQIHVVFRTEGNAVKEIAFIDDASGIDSSFLPHATKWGGSSNDGRRNTFGRFGFGLPSASVNRGRKFDVISRVDSAEPFRAVTVDLDNLVSKNNLVQLPKVDERPLPDWVAAHLASTRGDGKPTFRGGEDAARTVVIWSKLDRLEWKNRLTAAARFKEHLGITYASWLAVVDIMVDGAPVEAVDVLFTTPGFRYYDIEGFPKAEPHSSIEFTVSDADGVQHPVTVRFSLLSKAAYAATASPTGRGRPAKVRQRIRSDYNGFFVTRNGRFIELAKPSLVNWSVYARQVGVALDFPPALDELFGVTPDKQTIVFTDRLTKLLESHGVKRAFMALYKQVEEERHRLRAEHDREKLEGGKRPSEETIAKVVEIDVRGTRKRSEDTAEESERNLREKVKDIVEQTGIPEEEVAAAQEKLHQEKPYQVQFARQTEDEPFFTPYMEGTQLILRLNTEHPWYRELYSRLDDDQAEIRSGLELMLWVLATCEVDAGGDTRTFYRAERREWSRRMANAFDLHPLMYTGAASRDELDDDDPRPWVEDAETDEG